MDPTTLMCSLPYWRKNKWNGAACKPVLMTLESGRLRAWDQQGEALFDAHIDAVEAKLSMAGTLTLRIEGRKWDFVGRGRRFRRSLLKNNAKRSSDSGSRMRGTNRPIRPGVPESRIRY